MWRCVDVCVGDYMGVEVYGCGGVSVCAGDYMDVWRRVSVEVCVCLCG